MKNEPTGMSRSIGGPVAIPMGHAGKRLHGTLPQACPIQKNQLRVRYIVIQAPIQHQMDIAAFGAYGLE